MESVKFTDNSDLFKQALSDKIAVALEALGQAAESYAKLKISEPKQHANGTMKPNVETGRLRNSITHAVDDDTAYIGTNVEYAAYVEMGTSRMRPYPYLKPAITEHTKDYQRIIEKELKK